MTINELVALLEEAADFLPNGRESEVKLASGNSHPMRYAVGAVAIRDLTIDDPDVSEDPESLCWLIEGAQDRDRPYGVPELESITL